MMTLWFWAYVVPVCIIALGIVWLTLGGWLVGAVTG